MERSLAFYQGIIGLKLNRRFTPPVGGEIVFLGEGDTEVELIVKPGATGDESGAITLGFATENPIEEAMELVKSKGIEIESGPFQPNDHIQFFYIRDPDNHKVQISYSF